MIECQQSQRGNKLTLLMKRVPIITGCVWYADDSTLGYDTSKVDASTFNFNCRSFRITIMFTAICCL